MVDNCESFYQITIEKFLENMGYFPLFHHFFSHHFSTIEGGYFLTDDFDLYCIALSLRSHGWTRESSQKIVSYLGKKYSDFERSYKFVLPGYNLRPITEINAILGLEQIKKNQKIFKIKKN